MGDIHSTEQHRSQQDIRWGVIWRSAGAQVSLSTTMGNSRTHPVGHYIELNSAFYTSHHSVSCECMLPSNTFSYIAVEDIGFGRIEPGRTLGDNITQQLEENYHAIIILPIVTSTTQHHTICLTTAAVLKSFETLSCIGIPPVSRRIILPLSKLFKPF